MAVAVPPALQPKPQARSVPGDLSLHVRCRWPELFLSLGRQRCQMARALPAIKNRARAGRVGGLVYRLAGPPVRAVCGLCGLSARCQGCVGL